MSVDIETLKRGNYIFVTDYIKGPSDLYGRILEFRGHEDCFAIVRKPGFKIKPDGELIILEANQYKYHIAPKKFIEEYKAMLRKGTYKFYIKSSVVKDESGSSVYLTESYQKTTKLKEAHKFTTIEAFEFYKKNYDKESKTSPVELIPCV